MRILIVDDHEVVRRGVRSLLSERDWDVCGEAVDGQDAIEKVRELTPDVIVMDVSMPRLNGLDATREIRTILPQCEVVILSQHDNREMARQALKAGAHGYVVKSSISRDLVSAIAKASRHEYFFDPAILDESGSPHTDSREILQRAAAFERALREREQQLRHLAEYQSAVMNNMAEGLYALDANGIVTSINPAGEAILGWKKDELLGKKMHDLTHYKHPDGRPYQASECPLVNIAQNGTILREREETFIHRDGSFVPIVVSASPLRENGRIAGVIVSFRDDTVQRRAREALSNAQREREISTSHLELVTNFMAAFVTRCSKEFRYLWVSQACAEWLHRPAGEIIGKPIVEVLGREAFDKLLPYFKRVLAGERVSYEEEILYPHLGHRWIMATYTPTFDAEGVPDGWIAVLLDITERKRAEQAQREQLRRIEAAFSQSYSFLVLLEPDGTVIEANRAALDAAGKDASQVIGRKAWDLWWPPLPYELAALKSAIEKAAKGESVREECDFCLPDGSRRVGDRTLSPVFDQHGKVGMIVATGLDITDRKQTEMALAGAARQQKALFDLADELHRAGSMEEVFNAALNAILNALQCNRASILLCDEAGVMRFRSWRGLSREYRKAVDGHSAWKPGEKNPLPVCVADIHSADLSEPLKAVVKKEGIAALAFMPLVSNGRLIGKFMAYFNTPHAFTANEIDIGLTIARQLAFAIDRMRNDEALERSQVQLAKEAERYRTLSQELDGEVHSRTLELQRQNAQLIKMSGEARTLSRHLFEAQDQERRKIARNLHDSAGQTLAFLAMTVHQLMEQSKNYPEITNVARQIVESVRHLDREIRTASYLLHPPLLDESGLVSAVRMYLEGLQARSELEITLSVSEDFQRLPQEMELVLFRLVQECVTNIHKHAGCRTASIRFENVGDHVVAEIRDDGNGIPPEKMEEVQTAGSGLGIRGMRERVKQFEGSFILESNGSGTRVQASIPLPKELVSRGKETLEAAV